MAEDPLAEAIQAIRDGDKEKARQILNHLVKKDPAQVDAWLWLSAVAETPRQRIACLQEALARDPHNPAARRGLVLLGALAPQEAGLKPVALVRREWKPRLGALENPGLPRLRPTRQLYALGGLFVLAMVVLVGGAIWGGRNAAPRAPLPPPGTARPSATYLPTFTPVVRSPTPTFTGPTPLWMFLEATYTPTPIYVNTPHPRTEAYRGGIRAYQRGDWSRVINYMQQVAVNEPGAADVYFYTGEAYRMLSEPEKALAQYDRSIQAQPSFAPAYLGRARAMLMTDPLADVGADLEAALANDPDLAEAYLVRAESALAHKDAETALEALAAAGQKLPGSPLVPLYRAQADLLLGQTAAAVEDANLATTADFTLLPAYRVLGEAYLVNGQPKEAQTPLQTYLRYREADASAWVLIGKAYAATQAGDQAEAAFSQALKLDDGLYEAYYQRSLLYLDRQEGQPALDDLDQALKLQPDSFEATLAKGRALLLLDRPGEALRVFNLGETLAQADGDRAGVYYWRAQVNETLGRLPQAIQDWQALLALPEGSANPEWTAQAQSRLDALITPQPTPGV